MLLQPIPLTALPISNPSPSASVSLSGWPRCSYCLFSLPVWVPSSRPSSPSCKNRAFPRGGSSIPNSIRSVAQSFSSRSFNSLWGSGRRAWELLLKGTAPRPPTGPQGPGSALSRPLASLFSTLGQLSHPLLSLSHFFLHDIRLLPGLERGREEQWEGECHLCPLPLSSTRGGSGHRMVST